MISIIAAVGKNLELGRKNELIWKIRDDMKYFREVTSYHTVIVGLNTYGSFPDGLPNRNMIVITDLIKDNPDKGISTTVDVSGLIEKYSKSDEEVFVIGGAYVYSQFIDYADRIYLTEIDDECFDADVFFPKFDKNKFRKSIVKSGIFDDIKYEMCLYQKK